jgi:hypothetical protein
LIAMHLLRKISSHICMYYNVIDSFQVHQTCFQTSAVSNFFLFII